MVPSPSVSLRLFGAVVLAGADGSPLRGPPTQRHRLALLTLLALAGNAGLGREKLMGYLWPDRDTTHARQLLKSAVYRLRQALGDDALRSAGDVVRLDLDTVRVDVAEFEAAVAERRVDAAVALYGGPFLDGFFLPDAPEFEHWAATERARLALVYATALERGAEAAVAARDLGRALTWWTARAAHDPYDSGVALRLMRALEAGDNAAGALQHAEAHTRRLRTEFGIDPAPAVTAFVARLRRASTVSATPQVTGEAEAVDRAAAGVPPSHTLASGPERPIADAPEPVTHPLQASRVIFPPVRRQSRLRHGVVTAAACAALLATSLDLTFRGRGTVRRQDAAPAAMAGDPSGRRGPVAPVPRARLETQNVAAYELYRRGDDPVRFREDSSTWAGVELLQQAIARDSTFAAPWAGLAKMYIRVSPRLAGPAHVRYQRLADGAARRAVALDDSLADGHMTLGVTRLIAFDFAAAERHLARAVALDPSRAEPHEFLVMLYLWRGRPAEALAQAERAVVLEPLSPTAHAELAHALLGSDRCDEALAELAKLAALRPPLVRVGPIAAQCYARQGRWMEGIAALRPVAERGWSPALATTGYLLARAGRRQDALRIRATLLAQWRRGAAGAYEIGLVTAGLGDVDRAVAWFERAVADRSLGGALSPAALWLVLPGPLADDLRGQPRFHRLCAQLGIRAP